MADLFKLQGTIDVDNSAANSAIDETVNKANTAATSMGSGFASIGKTFSGIGGVLSGIGKAISGTVTAGVVGLGVSTAKTAVSFLSLKEGARTAFSVLLGGAEEANKMLDDLYTFAKTTPFSYDTYLKAGKTLAAMGIEAESVIPYLQGITNAAIATGSGQQGVESLSQAIGRMASTGKVTLETLNVLTYSGIPAVKILANQYGVTTEKMFDMISKGEILGEVALPLLIDGMEKGTEGAAGLTAAYGGLAKEMKGNLQGATDSLHSAFRNAALQMWDAENAFPYLISLIQEFKETVSFLPDIFQAVHDAAAPALQKITGWLETLNDTLENAEDGQLKKIGDAILKIAAAGPLLIVLGKAFSTVGGMITKLTPIVNTLKPAFKKAKDSISEWASTTKTKLSEAKGYFKNAFSDIKDVFSALGGAIHGLVAPIVDPIILKFSDLKTKIGEKFSGIGNTIKTKLSNVKTVTSGIFGNATEIIKNKVGGWGSAISEKLTPIKNKISNAFSGIAEQVGAPLQEAFGKAKSAMGNFGKGVSAMGGVFGGVLKGAGLLSVGLVGLAGVAASSGVDIQAKVDGIVQKVTDFAANLPQAMNNLIPALQNGLTQIVNVIPQLETGITQALTAIGGALPALINGLVSALPTFITTLINGAVTLFMALVNAIPLILPPLINALPTVIMAIINGLTANIPTLVQGAVQVFMAIVQAIPQIATALIEAAPDIINGLIEGLKAGWESIKTAASDLGKQLLDSFKNFFGIHSQSTVMTEQGGHIVAGLVNGIKDIGTKIATIFQDLKNRVVNKVTEIKTNVVNKFNDIKTGITDKVSSTVSAVQTKFNDMKNKITEPIKQAKDKVSEYIGNIKSFFTNFSAKIKVPHFKISNASLNPKDWIEHGIPKISVDWYKKGAIFTEGVMTKPTAFGVAPNGNLRVGGEAEAEAVAPISKLQEYVAAAATSGNAELAEKLDTLISLLTLYLPLLLNRGLTLDSGASVGELAPLLDVALGDLSRKKARGRA